MINKKNRTACKACRLKKCLFVGMSKSGSRYGRRSNWFKIHCLIQEQRQAADAAAQGQHNHLKPPNHMVSPLGPPSHLGLLGHPGMYPPGLYPRTKEEFIMLGLDDYKVHNNSATSPSISSPDSHNSDSSIDMNMRNNAMLKSSKDLFLPMTFPGMGSFPVMPPPTFLPPTMQPSHLFGYHPFYHPNMMKSSSELSPTSTSSTHILGSPLSNTSTNISRFTPNHSEEKEIDSDRESPSFNNNNNITNKLNNNHIPNGMKSAEEFTKRFYLDAVLKNQQQPDNGVDGSTRSDKEAELTSDGCDDEEDEDEEELVVQMTPPRSPVDTKADQDNPIDLSMKIRSNSTMSSKSSELGSVKQTTDESDDEKHSDNEETEDHTTTTLTTMIRKRSHVDHNDGNGDEVKQFESTNDIKRMKIQITTTPLDLTTRV